MTELSPVSHVSPCDDSIKHGSVRLLLPNLECKVSVYIARITDLLIWNDKNNGIAMQKNHKSDMKTYATIMTVTKLDPTTATHRFRLAKQQLCACIALFCKILCRRCTTTT